MLINVNIPGFEIQRFQNSYKQQPGSNPRHYRQNIAQAIAQRQAWNNCAGTLNFCIKTFHFNFQKIFLILLSSRVSQKNKPTV